MNVYEQTYTEEFIKELPINFNEMKNKDLSTIPEDFHCLFTTDWNWGNHSKMHFIERNIMNDISREFTKLCITGR